jgi:hypothetical protein
LIVKLAWSHCNFLNFYELPYTTRKLALDVVPRACGYNSAKTLNQNNLLKHHPLHYQEKMENMVCFSFIILS